MEIPMFDVSNERKAKWVKRFQRLEKRPDAFIQDWTFEKEPDVPPRFVAASEEVGRSETVCKIDESEAGFYA